MQKRFNLLAFPANMVDATSFYRAIGPLGHLRRTCPWLNIQIVAEVTWPILEMCDGLFLQRPFTPNMVQLCDRARAQGKPIWVDHDDDVFNVPDDNPCFDTYANPRTQQCVARVIASADFVTVSTEPLRTLYGGLSSSLDVVPNALMHTIVGEPMDEWRQNPVVLWRGSDTHKRDLMQHADQLVDAAKRHPSVKFHFSGYRPFFIAERLGDQCVINGPLDIVDYFGLLRTVRPQVVVVPLADHKFNHAKSNIAWIEATYAGAIVVAPNFVEWQRPGVINYNGADDIGRALDEALSLTPEATAARWRESRDYIDRHLRIERVNGAREEIIKRMQSFNADARRVSDRIRSPMVRA